MADGQTRRRRRLAVVIRTGRRTTDSVNKHLRRSTLSSASEPFVARHFLYMLYGCPRVL